MLFRNSSIYILAKVIPGLMAIVALSLYTHFLSPEEYGLYTLILSGTVLLHSVLYDWLTAGTLRFWYSKKYSQLVFMDTLAVSHIRISLLLFLIAILLVVYSYFFGGLEISWILSSFAFLLALALFYITQSLFTVKLKPLSYAYLTISYSIIALGLGTTLAYFGYGATGVIIGITVGTFIPALFVFKTTWKPFDKNNYDKDLAKKLLTYGLPFASAALLEELTKVSDRFMLAWLHDKSQAGLYAVGYDLSGNTIIVLMTAINLAAYPAIVKLLESEGKGAAMAYFRQYAIFLLGISIPAVIGLNLVGPDIVYLLIDEQYQKSVIFLLPWITLAVFMMGLQATYFDLSFQLGQYVIAIVKIGIVIATFNLLLNYWLIPDMGMQGAAIATLSSFMLGSILSAVLGRRCFKLPFPFIEFLKILISSLVMGFCLWWLKDLRGWGWLILQLLVGIASYFIMIVSFNILNIRSHLRGFR